MPFQNSPDNMNALRMLGQTIVQGRNQNARTALQVALARQEAERRARQDALQGGVWEAQAARARTQAALDGSRQKEIDDRVAAIEQLSQVLGDTNNTPESSAMRTALGRLVGHGRSHVPENVAQINALGDPRMAAMMATGSHIPASVPAGATAPDAATGLPAWQAAPNPTAPRSDVGAIVNGIQAALGAQSQVYGTLGPPANVDTNTPTHRTYTTYGQTVNDLINLLQERLGMPVRTVDGKVTQPTPPPVAPPVPRQPTIYNLPGRPAPPLPEFGPIPTNLPPLLQREGTNAAPGVIQGLGQPGVQREFAPGPVEEWFYDVATGTMVRKPQER